MKNFFYTLGLFIAVCCFNLTAIGQTVTYVDSGTNHIKAALLTAAAGDILVLRTGQTYTEDTLVINKNITIKGESFSALPLLADLPIIKKAKGGAGRTFALINLWNGANLTLQYLAVDNNLGETMFRPDPRDTGAIGVYFRTVAISVDHCRLYNVGNTANYVNLTSNMGNVFDIPADSLWTKRTCKTILQKCHFTNNLIYDIAGRGIYLKAYAGPADVLIQNNTFSNIGQQLTLPRFYKLQDEPDPIISVSFANNTCWKLSANTSIVKEFIGQWNGTSPIAGTDQNFPPAITYDIKDNIFAHQIVQTSSSTPNVYNISPFSVDETDFKANIFNDCGEVYFNTTSTAGSGTGISKIDTDPVFSDTSANDFTLGNTDWIVEGKATKGAIYWAPGYVDVNPASIEGIRINSLVVYPNPVADNSTLILNLKKASNITVDIININGQLMRSVFNKYLPAGNQNIAINASNLSSGIYILRVSANESSVFMKVVKR